MRVTKHIEFSMAHRLPFYGGACESIHGHRYFINVTVEGKISEVKRANNEGMVLDFKILKNAINEVIFDKYDHSLMLYANDPLLLEMTGPTWEKQKINIVPYIPTAENMAQFFHNELQKWFDVNIFKIVNVRVFETPTSWADSGDI